MVTGVAIGLLSHFRVLDLTNDKGYYFCAKILGDLGAEVIRAEKPATPRDFWWLAYNYNKKLVYFDIAKEPDKLLQLAREVDFLIESFPPGYLDSLGLGYITLRTLNPGLIMTSMTPFGQTGPYRDFKASDLEIMALSARLSEMGDPDRPPVRITFPQSQLITSAEAAVGMLIALCQRENTGEGQQVDVSAQESVVGVLTGGVRRRDAAARIPRRLGGGHPSMPGIRLGGGQPRYYHPRHPMIWKCQDGHVSFLIHPGTRGAHTNRTLVKYMEREGDLPDFVRNIEWENHDWGQVSPEEAARIWEVFARFFARHTSRELYQIALKERIELFQGSTVRDLLTEEQLEARGFWQAQELPDLGKTLKLPGPFAHVKSSPPSPQPETRPEAKQDRSALPFQGVKVLDFSWVVTGPRITQWLAVYGAEVIRVETSSHLDAGRRGAGAGIGAQHSSKKSLTLNLKHPQGKELGRRLVGWADVIVENFTPGTIQRLGFGYDEVVKINPRIVMLSASMFGADGPHAAQPGLGQILTSFAGFDDLTGWPDRLPAAAGPYTDMLAFRTGATVLFAAIANLKRTGKGCYLDFSQFESGLHFLAPLVLEYQATGKLLSRMGNRSLTDAPHGVFPCLGKDRWCAISVSTNAEWQAFCETIGKPEWVKDPRFATFEGRKRNEDELEKLIAAWTAPLTAAEVMERLQKAGVKAGLVADVGDLYNDPQLEHQKHFRVIEHPQVGKYDYPDSGFRLEKAAPVLRPAPLLGEHNRYVSMEILGLSEEEFNAYLASGVFE